MSTIEDRANALNEHKGGATTERAVAKIELAAGRKVGQGEYVGVLAGAFGGMIGGRKMQFVVKALQTAMFLGALIVMALGLIAASG